MKELAAFLEGGPATGARFAQQGFTQPELARQVLAGRRVIGLGEIWARASADLPASLAGACLSVCSDRAEAAALLLGPPAGAAVTLEEVAQVAGPDVIALARRMTAVERAWFFRLVSGARRGVTVEASSGPGSCRAVLTMVEAGSGQFAVRRGNALLPLVKLPLGVHGAEVMAWARGAVLERFGPLRSVRAELVFSIGWEGQVINTRRKLGFDLVGARVLDWERALGVEAVSEM